MNLALGISMVGLASALYYLRARQWISALLALAAGLALAAFVGGRSPLPGSSTTLTLITEGAPADAKGEGTTLDLRGAGVTLPVLQLAFARAEKIILLGDGLNKHVWQDLPARALQWQAPTSEALWLDFPRELALGRMFNLSVRRATAQPNWRLQLLAENDQVIAEAAATAPVAQLTLQWLPPLAERMVLQARLLDGAGKIVASGPVPLQVSEAPPSQVQARFDAASFDAQALNQLLVGSGALLDWQVTLGKTIARQETARTALKATNLLVVDAAWMEHASSAARAGVLAQVAQGTPLIVLGANAQDSAFWTRELALPLQPPDGKTEKDGGLNFNLAGARISLPFAAYRPGKSGGTSWTILASDDAQQAWAWQRSWQKGRIVWLGAADWHRYAISAPQALGLWWQDLLDRAGVLTQNALQWQQADAMPQPAVRSEICAQGADLRQDVKVQGQDLHWQARSDKADSACVAVWPQSDGWLNLDAGAGNSSALYVYAKADWPMWQQGLRRNASMQFAARHPARASAAQNSQDEPVWPWAALFALCMAALWWRERR
jgi:hypothetical protein